MTAASTTSIVVSGMSQFSTAAVALLALSVGLAVGIFVYKWGSAILLDQSARIGGLYIRKLPYAGYHRFRSRRWNMEHTA